MRVALVNDLKLALEALRRVIRSMPDAELAWIALDGREAVSKCSQDVPDLILMDLIMPVMNGVDATRQIMRATPCPILVTTATVSGNRALVYDALGAGAVDAVETPVLGRDGSLQGAEALIRKMRSVIRIATWQPEAEIIATTSARLHTTSSQTLPVVAIGSSTGGPEALRQVLTQLKPRCAVVIVQHLERTYTAGLAKWLADVTPWQLSLVEKGQTPQAGHAYLADTTDHLVLDSAGRFDYVAEPRDHLHHPSVDVFYSSLCQSGMTPGVAILLTGMGRDGAAGLRQLRDAGWMTVAQDEQSSVVWGMPGTAVREGAARQVLPVDEIGEAVNLYLSAQQNPTG